MTAATPAPTNAYVAVTLRGFTERDPGQLVLDVCSRCEETSAMKTAFKKLLVGVNILVVVCAVLFAPRLVGPGETTDVATLSAEISGLSDPAIPSPTEIQLEPASQLVEDNLAAPPVPTGLPAAVIVSAQAIEPAATTEPTSDSTVEPTSTPQAQSAVEESAVVESAGRLLSRLLSRRLSRLLNQRLADVSRRLSRLSEPTPEPTVEPTPEPTVEPTPEATPEPTSEPAASSQIENAWMFVLSSNGINVRSTPAGQIFSAVTSRSQVHVTGKVVVAGDHQWAQIDVPVSGWVALSFLTFDQPVPTVDPGPNSVPSEPPTAADWAALRLCESSGNYNIVDWSGLYHGAYQFWQPTWDRVARSYWPELVGVLPSQATPADQDKMANQLFELEGDKPWPVCGLHLR